MYCTNRVCTLRATPSSHPRIQPVTLFTLKR